MSETIVTAPAEKGERPIRFSDALLAVATSAVVTLAVGGLIGALLAMIWMAQKLPGNPGEIVQTDFYAVVGLTTAINAVILVLLFQVAKRFTKHPIGYFFPRVSGVTIRNAFLTALAVMALGLAVETALKYGWHIDTSLAKTEQAMSPKSWPQLGVVLVCFALFVPFYEEYLFRGFIFGWLKRVMPVWIAIGLSAAVFALAHGLFVARGGVSGWIGTGEIFVLGCVMSWWVARTGSLTPAYVIHVTNNALAFALAFLLPNLP
jgi:membrane protease YdiL (CAAX protease family)